MARVEIGTGRTHQIRVHMADIGHVLCGDTWYGAAAGERGFYHRVFLHHRYLKMPNPLKRTQPEEYVDVHCPLIDCPDFLRMLARLHDAPERNAELKKLRPGETAAALL